jgi:cell division protein FtsB
VRIPGAVLALAGVAVLALGLSFLYVVQATALRDLIAQETAGTEKLVRIEEVNRTLEFQIEQAFSLERIAGIARGRLGMVEPSEVRYVVLPPSDG